MMFTSMHRNIYQHLCKIPVCSVMVFISNITSIVYESTVRKWDVSRSSSLDFYSASSSSSCCFDLETRAEYARIPGQILN